MKLTEQQKQQKKKYEEWENPEEGIHYNLSILGETTYEDERNTFLIIQVLKRLPKKIREKVIDEVTLIHTTADGTLCRWPAEEVTFIILNFRGIKTDKVKMRTIAHEIGHFISSPKNPLKPGPADRNEKMADDLAEKWGFGRAYKSYKKFKGVSSII